MSSIGTKKPIFLPIIGIAVMCVAVYAILFAGPAVITQESIEARLQQFADNISREAAKNGKEGKFTYGAVTLDGWGFDKHANVENVTLAFGEKSALDTHKWSLSTTKMQVMPDPSRVGNLLFTFPETINVIENSQLQKHVTFSAPLKYGFYEGMEKGQHVVEHSVHLPPQIIMEPANSAEQTEKAQRVVISYDANPTLRVRLLPEANQTDADYDLSNIKLVAEDGTEASVASLVSHFHEEEGPDHRPQGKYSLQMTDLSVHDKSQTSKPYSLSADINYTGPQITGTLKESSPGAGTTDVDVKDVTLSNKDFKISAAGHLSTSVDDPLPFGALNLHITNVPQLLTSDILPESGRKIIAAALQKITGRAPDTLTAADVPLKRERNNVLYVGDTTFEALAASMFSDMLKGSPSQAQQQPKETAPAQATDNKVLPPEDAAHAAKDIDKLPTKVSPPEGATAAAPAPATVLPPDDDTPPEAAPAAGPETAPTEGDKPAEDKPAETAPEPAKGSL